MRAGSKAHEVNYDDVARDARQEAAHRLRSHPRATTSARTAHKAVTAWGGEPTYQRAGRGMAIDQKRIVNGGAAA